MRRIIICLVFCIVFFAVKAQDVRFSQYYSAPQLYNPAFTGYFEGDVRAYAIYKSQWESPFNAYRIIGGGADFAILKNKLNGSGFGVGINFFSDQAGDLDFSTNQLMLSLGYTQRLGSMFPNNLSLGFQMTGANRSINMSNSIFESDIVGGSGENIHMDNYWFFSMGVGMLWYAEPVRGVNFYVGGSAFNLLKPNQSFYNDGKDDLFVRYVGQMGVNFDVNESIDVSASAMYQRQGPFQEFMMGFLGRYDFSGDNSNDGLKVGVGLWYRMQDAVIPVVRLEYSDFILTFNYDANISTLKQATRGNGGPELSLTYSGFWNSTRKKSASKMNTLGCPVL